MADREEVEVEIPDHPGLMRQDRMKLGKLKDVVFLELVLDQGKRQRRAVDIDAAELAHNPGQRTYMVFMPVRQHNAQHLVLYGRHGPEVRYDDIDAQMLVRREHQAAVHHDHAAGCFPQLAVKSYFSQAAKRRYDKFLFIHIFIACKSLWHGTKTWPCTMMPWLKKVRVKIAHRYI